MPCMLAGGVLLCFFSCRSNGEGTPTSADPAKSHFHLNTLKRHLKTLKDTLKSDSVNLLNFKLVSLI